jgi:hypothetical protein
MGFNSAFKGLMTKKNSSPLSHYSCVCWQRLLIKNIKIFHLSEFVPELSFTLDFLGLYDRFIEIKYETCLEEKCKISTTKVFVKEAEKNLLKTS